MARKLRAPSGTTEASVGTTHYPVDTDGTITLPDDDAARLLDAATGFVDADPVEPAPRGFARVHPPEGCTSLSYLGAVYEIETDGTFIVPVDAVGDLIPHGFTAAHVVPGVVLDSAVQPAVEPEVEPTDAPPTE